MRKIKAHEVRAVAASWAFFKNVSVEDIMRTWSWRNHNTFTSNYLRDMTYIQDEMRRIGPVVCAGRA